MSHRTIYGYWDCPYCGTKGIRGDHRTCPNCGKPRGDETHFYMKGADESQTVHEAAGTQHHADWYCSFCDALNPYYAENCLSCGSPRSEADKNYFDLKNGTSKPSNVASAEEQADHNNTDEQDVSPDSSVSTSPSPDKQPEQNSWIDNLLRFFSENAVVCLIVLGVAIMTLIIACMAMPQKFTVLDQYWNRTVTIEQYKLETEEDKIVPSDAVQVLGSEEKIDHYDQRIDHYRTVTEEVPEIVSNGSHESCSYSDNGDGTFGEDCESVPDYTTEYHTETHEEPVYVDVPVYERYYTYTIWEWVPERTVKSSAHNKTPYDGEYTLKKDERKGDTQDIYYLVLQDKNNEKKTYHTSKDAYKKISVNDVVTGSVWGRSFQLRDIQQNEEKP